MYKGKPRKGTNVLFLFILEVGWGLIQVYMYNCLLINRVGPFYDRAVGTILLYTGIFNEL